MEVFKPLAELQGHARGTSVRLPVGQHPYPREPKTLGERIRKKRMDEWLEVRELSSALDLEVAP